MVWSYNLADLFSSPGKQLDKFNIRSGQTVVDYGCGPGRYLKKASELVGKDGKVYAADVHPLAMEYSKKRIEKDGLKNVETVLVKDNSSSIPDKSTDMIYAIDMFHHVDEPKGFLEELHRIAKPSCKLFIEDGHQSREKTIKMASVCHSWKVVSQQAKWVQFSPK
jgi:ubiquinone/menaquinone biosynthesis C-methylase UbiE